MDDFTSVFWSIGHSNHPLGHFEELLRRHGVEAVADVRSRPYSRFAPHFRKDRLERSLPEAGVAYHWFGRELGGKPPRDAPERTRLDYRSRVAQPEFRCAIDELLEMARRRRTALMCRERDPLDCHRTHLICRYIRPMVGAIWHILPDGGIEDHGVTEQRLLARVGRDPLPLFEAADAGEDNPLERAYDRAWPYGA